MEEVKNSAAAQQSESEQVQVRRQKLADLRAAGRDPFEITKFPQDAYSADLKAEYADLPSEADAGRTAALAGRMMSKRVMGKASFAHLRDDKGDIQLYIRRDELGEEAYAAFKKLDVGDVIGVKGEVFRTKTGELSVRALELTLLAKSLRPLPEKFHGLTDTELRYRQRYVDLIANPEVKDTFVKRSRILKEIRGADVHFEAPAHSNPSYHPGRVADVYAGERRLGVHPVQHPFDLAPARARHGIGIIRAAHARDLALVIRLIADALDDVRPHQPHFLFGRKALVLGRRN